MSGSVIGNGLRILTQVSTLLTNTIPNAVFVGSGVFTLPAGGYIISGTAIITSATDAVSLYYYWYGRPNGGGDAIFASPVVYIGDFTSIGNPAHSYTSTIDNTYITLSTSTTIQLMSYTSANNANCQYISGHGLTPLIQYPLRLMFLKVV